MLQALKHALAIALLTGCDVVVGIDKVGAPPDAPACDRFDEDGDGFGNACDLCPADRDDGTDTDVDRVGDACDPERADGVDRIAFFDGFDANTNPWVITAGDWQLQNGAFVVPTATTSRVELALAGSIPTVEAIIPTYMIDDTGSVGLFGASGVSQLRCSVTMTAGVESLRMEAFLLNAEKPIPATAGPLRLSGGQHHDGTFYCRARHGDNFDVELMTGTFAPQAIDKIGLITTLASATVTSITFYDVP
jgi:hypothetical protein